MDMTVGEIASMVGGTVEGDPSVRISGVGGIREARSSDLTFLAADSPYQRYLETTHAGAILVPTTAHANGKTLIFVPDPRVALFTLLKTIDQKQAWRPQGIHSTAIIGPDVAIGADVVIDAHSTVGDGSVLESRVTIHAGVRIGRNCRIGQETILYENVTIRDRVTLGAKCIVKPGAVIGADGFGFIEQQGAQIKVPQVGTVTIGDNCEIGANSCIDRATFGTTVIGSGSKIDNLVQIGHNVQLGRNCVVCGNAGIAGSAVLADNVTIGAAAGIKGHIEIGEGATVGALAGVTKSIRPGAIVSGFPAVDVEVQRRKEASLRQLPDALHRIKSLEQRLAQLEGTLNGTPKDDR